MSQVTLIGLMKEKQVIGLISNFDVNYRGGVILTRTLSYIFNLNSQVIR
jgi:hypothetical protein